jgi:alpha-aminoadipate carrier protein LysW
MTTNCPECGAVLELSADVMAHEIIDCSTCGVELEVMATEPLTVSLAPDEEEDWGE